MRSGGGAWTSASLNKAAPKVKPGWRSAATSSLVRLTLNSAKLEARHEPSISHQIKLQRRLFAVPNAIMRDRSLHEPAEGFNTWKTRHVPGKKVVAPPPGLLSALRGPKGQGWRWCDNTGNTKSPATGPPLASGCQRAADNVVMSNMGIVSRPQQKQHAMLPSLLAC